MGSNMFIFWGSIAKCVFGLTVTLTKLPWVIVVLVKLEFGAATKPECHSDFVELMGNPNMHIASVCNNDKLNMLLLPKVFSFRVCLDGGFWRTWLSLYFCMYLRFLKNGKNNVNYDHTTFQSLLIRF